MIWFKKDIFFKPKDKAKKVVMPQGLWVKCDQCEETIYKKEIDDNLDVCPRCNHHFRMSARRRVDATLDEGSFKEFDASLSPVDAFEFKDLKKYKDRIKSAHKELEASGIKDAIVTGAGLINGTPVMFGAFEFSFMGGSMGSVVGEKITRLLERALEKKSPVVIFSSSGGARMQESILSLMQMAKTSAAVAALREKGAPFISVLTDPTMGGVTASFAMLGDVIIAEPKALIGFAGPRVIAETIKQTLPEGFQRSEYLLEHGMVDMIVERKSVKQYVSKVIALLSE
ncbi:MAG TPA: acetyl-CoA carboxylase, carboxyltransferase subunit beta [Thermodesulfobacteriota bacterium]|nr:acetyl-CoA carboxylase, carboxyltransferase subunit beta [Thermodesulfobacteriota bacterium]